MAIVRAVALVLAEEGQESGRLVDGVHVEREEELETVRVVRVGCIEEPFDCSRGELCVGLLYIECKRVETHRLRIRDNGILHGLRGVTEASDLRKIA